MTDRRPPTRLSLRFVVIAAIGGLMVLLPFGEVLRYQGAEIQELMQERSALDPMSRALQLQLSLLGHDQVASRVLAGRHQLEAERRLRQADVDGAIWDLKGTLSAGLWVKALDETNDLTDDWRDLARRVHLRQMDVPASQAAHRLLVEQALQVMDLVSAAAAPGNTPAALAQALAALTAPASPRQAAHDGDANREPHARTAAAQVTLTAHLLRVDQQLARLQSARRAQLAGLALLLLAATAATLWLWLQARHTPAPPPGPDDRSGSDGVRRGGGGRRRTDAQRKTDEAERLIWQLRQGAVDTVPQPSDTLPPGPDKT